MKWSIHKGLGHHQLITSQYMGGGPQVKGFKGCGLGWGEKEGLFWGSHSNFFGERRLVGMVSHPKEASMGWDHLMHAIKVGNREA